MRPLEMEKGPGAVTPEPLCNAKGAVALSLYAGGGVDGNPYKMWLLVPRAAIEHVVDAGIDWLDQIDGDADDEREDSL